MKRRPHRRAAAVALAQRLEKHAAEWRRLPPDVPVGLRNPRDVAAELEAAARALREVRDTLIDRARRAIRLWLLEPTAADRAFEHARVLNAGEVLSQKVAAALVPRIKRDLERAASHRGQRTASHPGVGEQGPHSGGCTCPRCYPSVPGAPP